MNSKRKIGSLIAAGTGAAYQRLRSNNMSIEFNLKQRITGASVIVALVSAGLTAVPVSVLAQTSNVTKLDCTAVGNSPPEALGDRPGHSISISEFTCIGEGGPLNGGVMWGTGIWEWDGINAVGRAGSGVVRGRGGHIVYVNTEMKNTLTMVDGKVTGFVITGRGYYPVATGVAAPVQGKTYSYVGKPGPGPGRFVLESTID